MFWSRNQKSNKKLLSQHPPQHNHRNQKYTSSNTRPKKKAAATHQLVFHMVHHQLAHHHQAVWNWAHQVQLAAAAAVLISAAADTDHQPPHTDHLANLAHTKCWAQPLVFYCKYFSLVLKALYEKTTTTTHTNTLKQIDVHLRKIRCK